MSATARWEAELLAVWAGVTAATLGLWAFAVWLMGVAFGAW